MATMANFSNANEGLPAGQAAAARAGTDMGPAQDGDV